MARARRRISPIRLVRALWRYRGQLEEHGTTYQVELATTVRTSLVATTPGRLALNGYAYAMRAMVAGIAFLVLFALLLAYAMWQLTPWAALAGLVPLGGAVLLGLWRLSWGAPLDWLREHADTTRTVTLAELPTRLHALAQETRTIANVPKRLADELDELARDSELGSG
ncbi:MAG: hypothetical protein JWL76_562 [Thermoleophilia bacterium]|nr:hypothetical protein [Thermoleophilia bacterium]